MLVEEGEADPLPSVRSKGNIYLLASGPQGAQLLRGLRDQYYGDPLIGKTLDVSAGALGSLEASASLLSQRETGVSCLAAVSNPPNRLSLIGAGESRAFLQERGSGMLKPLMEARYPHQKLAMESPGSIEKLQRPLSPGDRVILCCGPVAHALGPGELQALASMPAETRAQDLAEDLARVAGSAGGGAVMVLACHEAPPDLATHYFQETASKQAGDLPHVGMFTKSARKSRKIPLPWILAVFAAVIIGSAGLDSVGKRLNLPELSPPADSVGIVPGATTDLLKKLDDLWARGQKGDLNAWKEAVDLLRQLQSAKPGEPTIADKLRAAELNRQYGEVMGQVAVLWGAGETAARTVESWAKVVDSLDQLYSTVGGTGFAAPTSDKLYAARVNYGKALEAAGRLAEARAIYEQARQQDQSRPEATDALRRLQR